MLSDLQAIDAAMKKAMCPEEIFGPVTGAVEFARQYRVLAAIVHPDRYATEPATVQALANEVFSALGAWKMKGEAKLAAGTYGDGRPHVAPAVMPTASPVAVHTPKRDYVVKEILAHGDLADLYECSYVNGSHEETAVFKLARSSADNDLLDNERRVLAQLDGLKGNPFRCYLPSPLDSFLLRSDKAANRRVNVVARAGGYIPLTAVKAAYPAGLDPRDVAWIFKRGLVAIWFAHHQGYVHGAVLPEHLMVDPAGHGAKLVDWCYAVEAGQRVRAVVRARRDFYPPEVLSKLPATSRTDIYMLARCMVELLVKPGPFDSFLRACMLTSPMRRPQDAGDLHEEFDALLVRCFGKSTYRKLVMPAS